MQLDLFEHAPRHYHEAVACLARLDLGGCEGALDEHRRRCPAGPVAAPVEQALLWLRSRLPDPAVGPEEFAGGALALCHHLRRGGSAPALLGPATPVARTMVRTLAAEALRRGRAAGRPLSAEVVCGLPWGVFLLLSGDAEGARGSLLPVLRAAESLPAVYLVLGEACHATGRFDEARRAWREGYGLDPGGRSWGPEPKWITTLRGEFATDEFFGDDWWVVGAYLEGRLPRYARTRAERLAPRLTRFREETRGAAHGTHNTAVLFFRGIFLSEQGGLLPSHDLAEVRRAMRRLQAEAFATHMAFLAEHGPPAESLGREWMPW